MYLSVFYIILLRGPRCRTMNKLDCCCFRTLEVKSRWTNEAGIKCKVFGVKGLFRPWRQATNGTGTICAEPGENVKYLQPSLKVRYTFILLFHNSFFMSTFWRPCDMNAICKCICVYIQILMLFRYGMVTKAWVRLEQPERSLGVKTMNRKQTRTNHDSSCFLFESLIFLLYISAVRISFKKKIKISTQKRINHTDRKILYHTIVFMIWFRPFLFQFLCLFCYYSYTDFCLTILILCYIYTRRQTNVSSNVDKIVYLKDFLYSTLLLYNSRPESKKSETKHNQSAGCLLLYIF